MNNFKRLIRDAKVTVIVDSIHQSGHPLLQLFTCPVIDLHSTHDLVPPCVGLFHRDIPDLSTPSRFSVLKFLADVVIYVESFDHHELRKEAESRSRTDGVTLDLEGRDIFTPLGSNGDIFLRIERRRKSGRKTVEEFTFDGEIKEYIPSIPSAQNYENEVDERRGEGGEGEGTFRIGLSEKERLDRENVELPHLAAQRIYYTPDSADDFDEEDPDDDLLL